MSKSINGAVMLCIAALLFASCHPAQQLQRQDDAIAQLKAKWIFEWAQAHPCPPPPAINLDNLCQVLHNGDSTAGFATDFQLTSPATDTGKASPKDTTAISTPRRLPCSPRTILVPYQDTRMLDLLKDSLASKARQIAALQAGAGVQSQDCSQALAAARQSANKWIWWLIAACVLAVLFLILWLRSIF